MVITLGEEDGLLHANSDVSSATKLREAAAEAHKAAMEDGGSSGGGGSAA